MRILGPLPPAARSHLGAGMSPAAPAQAAHPAKNRRRLMPCAAQPTGILEALELCFISFSFPPNHSSVPAEYICSRKAISTGVYFLGTTGRMIWEGRLLS